MNKIIRVVDHQVLVIFFHFSLIVRGNYSLSLLITFQKFLDIHMLLYQYCIQLKKLSFISFPYFSRKDRSKQWAYHEKRLIVSTVRKQQQTFFQKDNCVSRLLKCEN